MIQTRTTLSKWSHKKGQELAFITILNEGKEKFSVSYETI